MPIACAPTVGRLISNVCMAAWPRPFLPSRARARRSSSFSLPPRRQEPGMRQSSRKTSAVCEARMPCFLTLVPISRPFVPGGMTNAAWPRDLSSLSTEATTTCTLAMPPLVAHAFCPFSTHSSLASSYLACVRSADTSEPASGSETQKAPSFGSSARAVALRHPLAHLLGRAGAEDAGDRERGAHDRHADAGVAPEELLADDRQGDAALVGPELGERLVAVEADLRGLLDDRPRGLLALVPLGGRGADDLLREAVDPVADLALLLGEVEGERPRPRLGEGGRRGLARVGGGLRRRCGGGHALLPFVRARR